MSSFQQKATQIKESMAHSKEKKNKSMENVPEKDLMVDLLDKQFKTTLLLMLNELKEDMVKAKKTMYKQSGNINRKPKKKTKKKF